MHGILLLLWAYWPGTGATIVAGNVPIEFIRSYDSRDNRVGDFGVGWTLDLKNIRLQKNRPLDQNWEELSDGALFPTYTLRATKPHSVTLTFPSQKVYKFAAVPTPGVQFGVPIIYPAMSYLPIGETRGSLASATGDELIVPGSIPGPVQLLDQEAVFTGDLNAFEYNPDIFEFTTLEGFRYVVGQTNGLKSITDPNGNTLTITTNGIIHSAGKSVLFQRDSLGRITNIIDAAGNSLRYEYDTNGDLAGFRNQANELTSFNYDAQHHLLGVHDPRGIEPVRNEYDAAGRLIRHIDAFGKTIEYTHDLNGRQEIVEDRLGNITVHDYDERGNVIQTTAPDGGVSRSFYDENDNLLIQIDPLNRTNSYAYDSNNNRTLVIDPLGNVTRFTYNNMSRVTSVTDPRGNSITNDFDAKGNLLSMRDPLGNQTFFAYNNRGLPVAMTNALGQLMKFGYDDNGRLTNEVDALGHETDYQRDPTGNLILQTTTRTTPNGVETLAFNFQYDAQNRLTNTLFPDGSAVQTIYNSIGKPAITIDQLGRQTSMDYDELGRVARTTYPDGSIESSAYDAEGRRIASTNRLGQVTQYSYDAMGRLFRTLFSDGTSTTNYFDLAGQLLASTDARGNSSFYGYDAAGRSVAVTNALGQVSRSFYDASGNLTNSVDALGRSTTFLYDPLNRRVQTVFTDGTTQTTWFDALGRRTHEQDQAGKVTAFGYDALGRLNSVTNALGYVTSYAYDELGQQLSQTDANNHTTTFQYDSMGRRVKRTLPAGQAESYGYNIAGLLTAKTDFNGFVTTFQYDVMNRLLAKIPDPRRGEPHVTYGYNALGLRTSMTDASGQTSYGYHARNRLLQKTRTWFPTPASPALSSTLNYGYDPNGNLTSIVSSNPNGTSLAYDYDPLNRLGAVTEAQTGRTAYSYDAVGNLRGWTTPNGINQFYQYDALNRLTNLTSSTVLTAIANYQYTVGPAGNRLSANETLDPSALNSHPSTINRVYDYDAIYRLTSESLTVNSQSSALNYSYDPVGNRLSRNSTLALLQPQAFNYDPDDRLLTDTYDANGNTLVGAGFAQTQPDSYDFENRLTSRSTANALVQIAYDGDGNRVSKTVTTSTNSVTTYFLVDELNPTGYAQVLEELAYSTDDPRFSSPAVTRVYTYGHALLTQDRLNGTAWSASFYGYDGHNNVRYLTDSLGQVTDTYDYDAFGNLIAATGATPNVYLFTGEQFDPDLGLYYLRARYHNPDTGRFWTRDALEPSSSTPNNYTYCNNDPSNRIDPVGRDSIPELSIATGLWSTARALFGGALGGLTGALAGGYDAILHGRVSNQEIAQAMTTGFREGSEAGGGLAVLGGFGSIGQFGASAIAMMYSGIGFSAAYQSYYTGNIEAGDFESALAAVGAISAAPGLARGSVIGARGLTSALETYYGGPKLFINVQRVPSTLANAGYEYAPFEGDALEFQTGRTTYFARLLTPLNKQTGKWLATTESVFGKTPAQLKQMFALEAEPFAIQVVRVPPGATLRAGRVAAQPQWGVTSSSDAVQYQLLNGIDADNFSTKTIPIQP